MNNSPIDIISSEIEIQLNKIRNSFLPEKRIAIVELVRCVDHAYVYHSFIAPKSEEENANEVYNFIATGYAEALKLFLDNSIYSLGYPLFPSNDNSIQWANSCLINLGHIGYIERFVELAKQKIFEVKQSANDFTFKSCCENPGREGLGAEDFYWWRNKVQFSQTEEERIAELSPKIESILKSETKIWRKHFISYGCTPILDEYYEIVGKRHAKRSVAFDSFPDESSFNGISFGEMKLVIEALMGYKIKHKDHCLVLLKKSNYKINPWNIYPLSSLIDELATSISEHKGIEKQKVNEIINLLTVTDKNILSLVPVPGSAPPPLIRIGKEHVLESIAGILVNPFEFLVGSLKLNHEKSFFNAVNRREDTFKNQLYSLFDAQSIHKANKNISLRQNGKQLTDIDALLYDELSKTLLIVQLKWFDNFGPSMKRRFNMNSNFYTSCISWIDTVLKWIDNNSLIDLAKRVDSVRSNVKVEKVELLIIGRNFSHLSGVKEDPRATWCSWYRLLKTIHEMPHLKDNLLELVSYLRENSLEKDPVPELKSVALKVGKYNFTIAV